MNEDSTTKSNDAPTKHSYSNFVMIPKRENGIYINLVRPSHKNTFKKELWMKQKNNTNNQCDPRNLSTGPPPELPANTPSKCSTTDKIKATTKRVFSQLR